MSSTQDDALKVGSIFAGRYRISGFLGEGDRKRTYLADDTVFTRQVALSLIKEAAAKSDPEGTRREAEALGKAGTNENIVTLHDSGSVDGIEYLVFDYLRGGTLREHMANRFAVFDGGQRPLDLRRATFGAWVELATRLARILRAVLAAEGGEERCCELFKTRDLELAEALTAKDLASIFRHACDRRNSWKGHGGVAGPHVQHERLQDLDDLLARTRAVLGWSFETWTLLKPGAMIRSGKVFDLTATILKGTNSAFRRQQLKLTDALDTARLYLLNEGNSRALELVPFIRVIAGNTGQDACYFYNRVEGAEVRWVSYHFHADPELLLPDEGVSELLATLSGAATREEKPA